MASNPKVSIKWKLFSVVAVLISLAVIVIVTRTSSIFIQDKEAFVKELSAKLASSLAKNVLTRITTLQDKLVIFISSRESLAHTGAKADYQLQVLFSRYQEFDSIGFLTPDAGGRLRVDWVARNPQSEAAKWPVDFEKSFLSTLNINAAAANGRGFWRAQTPDGQWLSVLGFGVQVLDVDKNKPLNNRGAQPARETSKLAWIVGVLPSNAFDDLLSDFSTGLNTGFVVDDQGIAMTHSTPENRWKNLKMLPIVEEAIKGARPAATGDFYDGDGRAIIGSFEFIPKMNLVAMVTTPRDKAFEAAQTLTQNIEMIGFLILLIALAVAILLSNYLTGPLQRLAAIAAKIGAGDFKVPVDVESNDEIGALAGSFKLMEQGLIDRDEKLNSAQMALVQSEKMSAFGQLSAGIAHEVKNPLAGILGHAQLAMGKVKSDDVKKHLEVIEKETRRCKTIVENLMKFARAEKAELKPTNLAQVAQDTINLVDHQLTLAGCKIYKDFRPCPMVDANGNMLQQVLLNLMVNASHAMEACPMKNVTVRILQVGQKAQIQVEDTGAGIPPEIQKKIFEPFFTTKPAGKGTGLGLSVSIGIVKDHKGEIYIKSEQGKGTTFFIDIPIPENAAMPDKPLENTHGGQIAPGAPDPATVTAAPATKPAPAAPAPAATPAAKESPTTTVAAATGAGAPAPSPSEASGAATKEISKEAAPAAAAPNATATVPGGLPKGLPKFKVPAINAEKATPSEKTSTEIELPEATSESIPLESNVVPINEKVAASNAEPVRKVESEDEFVFSDTVARAPVPKPAIQPFLGGKPPLDETTVNLPALPEENKGPEPVAVAVPMEKKEAVAAPVPAPSPAEATEFKVKIKRPKLKV